MKIAHVYRLTANVPNGLAYELGASLPDGSHVIVGPPVALAGEFASLEYERPAHRGERPGAARVQAWADARRERAPFKAHAFTSASVASEAMKALEAALVSNLSLAFGEELPRGNDGAWRAHVVPVLRGVAQYGMGALGLPYPTVYKRIVDHVLMASPDAPHLEELDRDLREGLEGGSYFVPVNAGAEALEAEHARAEELLARREAPKRARPIEAGKNTKSCAELGALVIRVSLLVGPEQVHPMLAPFLAVSPAAPALAEDTRHRFIAIDLDALGSVSFGSGEIAPGVYVMPLDEVPAVDAKVLRASIRPPTKELRRWLFDVVRPALRTAPMGPVFGAEGFDAEGFDLRTLSGQWRAELASRAIAPLLPFLENDPWALRLAFELLHRGAGLAGDVAALELCATVRAKHEARSRLEAELREAQGRVLEYDIRADKKIPWRAPELHEHFTSPASLMSAVRHAGFSDETPWIGYGELYREPSQAEAAEVAARMARDPWLPVLADFVGERPTVKSDELVSHLQAAADLRGDPTPHTHTRIHAAMVKLGFEKKQVQIAGNRFHAFVRVPAAEVTP